jgi:hypothetical protein
MKTLGRVPILEAITEKCVCEDIADLKDLKCAVISAL